MKRAIDFPNVEKATVKLADKGGLGVLVGDESGQCVIVTAAHCINFKCDGSMVLGDWFLHNIESVRGRFKATPLAIEPVSDIAVLGSPDAQDAAEEALRYDEITEAIEPIRLCLDEYKRNTEFPVYIFTHQHVWIEASGIMAILNGPRIWIECAEQVEGGTSGGPVVNDAGELVAIVSNVSVKTADGTECEISCHGLQPRPHLTLPLWVAQQCFGLKLQERSQ